MEQVIERAEPLADYYFSWLQRQHGATLEGKSRIAAEVNRILAKVSNPLEADLLARRAVDLLGIREELLRKPSGASKAGSAAAHARPVAAAPPAERGGVAERSLIALSLRLPPVAEHLTQEPEAPAWFGPKWRPVVDEIIRQWQERGNIDVAQLTQTLPAEIAGELAALTLEGERLSDAECGEMAADCVSHLRRKYLRERERDLRIAIRAAEEQRDENAKRERILEWQDLVRKKRQLERRKFEPKTAVP
jgi:DNA primase